jgi:hypothetical protein
VNKITAAEPQSVGMKATLGATLDSIVRVGLAEKAAPGPCSPLADTAGSFI